MSAIDSDDPGHGTRVPLLSGKSDVSTTNQGSDLVWVLRVGGICV